MKLGLLLIYLRQLILGDYYSAIFFSLVYLFSNHEGKIATLIGKILNPLFLGLLFLIFLLAFSNPLGAGGTANITAAYTNHAF